MEDLECPECGAVLTEKQLQKSWFAQIVKPSLRNPKYKDFLELLIFHEVVDDIDFFDMNLYGSEILSEEREDYDEPELDMSKFEKHKEIWDEFEDDLELNENLQADEDREEAWDIFNDDRAIEEDWDELKESAQLNHRLDSSMSDPKKNAPNQLKLELPESKAEGTYCNFTVISHSAAEFILDFARIMPGVPKATVQSRIIMTPIHAKTLLKTLQDNIDKFESTFGEIAIQDLMTNPFGSPVKPGGLPN